MANESSLALRVVVNANDADRTLQAITASINQMGVQAKLSMSQIGGASRAAGAEVISLGDRMKRFAREQRQEARTAGFFVQEIQQIIPISESAKTAIGGLGAALVGGVGMFSALQLVTTAIALFVRESEAEAEASRKATEAVAKRAEAYRKTHAELARLRFTQSGLPGDVFDAAQANAEAEAARASAQKVYDEARRAFDAAKNSIPAARNLTDQEATKFYDNLRALYAKVALAATDLANAEANRATVVELGSRKATAAINAEADAYARRNAEAAKGVPGTVSGGIDRGLGLGVEGPLPAPAIGTTVINPILQLDDSYRKAAEGATQFRQEVEALNDATAQSKFEAEEAAAGAAAWGNAVGGALGAVATGQATIGQALAQVGQMVIQSVVQTAIASITADAARAGAASAAATAGIPVVGPVMALSAMGAMMSAVLGLLGKVSARAMGGPVGAGMPYLVGERGPELMIPGSSGRIVPNHALGGGGVTVNVAALDGRSVERVVTQNDGDFARAMRKARRRRRM